jgi:hypothetical protein
MGVKPATTSAIADVTELVEGAKEIWDDVPVRAEYFAEWVGDHLDDLMDYWEMVFPETFRSTIRITTLARIGLGVVEESLNSEHIFDTAWSEVLEAFGERKAKKFEKMMIWRLVCFVGDVPDLLGPRIAARTKSPKKSPKKSKTPKSPKKSKVSQEVLDLLEINKRLTEERDRAESTLRTNDFVLCDCGKWLGQEFTKDGLCEMCIKKPDEELGDMIMGTLPSPFDSLIDSDPEEEEVSPVVKREVVDDDDTPIIFNKHMKTLYARPDGWREEDICGVMYWMNEDSEMCVVPCANVKKATLMDYDDVPRS